MDILCGMLVGCVGVLLVFIEKNWIFEMYKSILITQKESMLLEQILKDYLKNEPINNINVHILIRHICGTKAQYNRNGEVVCGKSTINQL